MNKILIVFFMLFSLVGCSTTTFEQGIYSAETLGNGNKEIILSNDNDATIDVYYTLYNSNEEFKLGSYESGTSIELLVGEEDGGVATIRVVNGSFSIK